MKSSSIMKKLTSHHYVQNYNVKKDSIIDELPTELKEIQEMGACLYYAENAKLPIDKIEFETENIEKWKSAKPYLEQLFAFLTDSIVKIDFIKTANRSKTKQAFPERNSKTCLFSGGVDSYCGTWFQLDNGQKVDLVHTSTNNKMQGIARTVYDSAFKNKANFYETRIQFEKDALKAKYPQTRSTLFLMNAMPLLHKNKDSEILIPENGVLMVNPPVSTLTISTKATRPEVLALNQAVASILLEKKVKIYSPFVNKTKAEVALQYHDRLGFNKTFSCFNYRWGKIEKMCGRCYGCNISRLSLSAIGYTQINKRLNHNPFLVKEISGREKERNSLFLYADLLELCKGLLVNKEKIRPISYNSILGAQEAYDRIGITVDVWNLMERFALDIFLGIKNMYEYLNVEPTNSVLGKKYSEILKTYKLEDQINNRKENLLKKP